MKKLRIFYTSDIHGSDRCFAKFINAWKVYSADVLILGGDITGKAVVPIIKEQGQWSAHFHDRDLRCETDEEVRALEQTIMHNGFYPYRTTAEEVHELHGDPERVKALFNQLIGAQIQRWMALADERLAGTGKCCFVLPGNDDDPSIDPLIAAAAQVSNPDQQVVEIGLGYQMISGAFSNATPWHSAREWEEERIASAIDGLMSGVQDPARTIFNLHCPPHATGIDTVQQIDEQFRPVYKNGHPMQIPAGSTATRAAILRYQPLLALHGHVHESKGTCKLGKTLCINPGSEYASGRLHGVLVDLDERRIVSHLFTMG